MHNIIIKTIKSTVYKANNLHNSLWKEPIIEIISANDEKLKTLKEAVSPEHLLPCDILPDAKSIISFFIPFNEDIVSGNVEGVLASKEWAITYIKTNELIKTINDNIEILMKQHGYSAGKIAATHNFDAKKLISNWSHRHIAFIAGLGTFGINNMLITKNGCCGRFGSIVINYEFDEYKKIEKIKEKCLNKTNRTCGLCQKKCPVSALQNNGYDRNICYAQCLKNAELHKVHGLADVCGKCLVGLPCSIKEPLVIF